MQASAALLEKRKEKTVIIILTHSCNLNCVYCYEHHKGRASIELDMAVNIIEKEMNAEDECDRIFEFFGGEPLLEFEKIVYLHSYLKKHSWKKKWVTQITTNGVLVDDDVKNWLIENRDTVQVALSCDGTREMHNMNRSDSYDLIDFDFFVNYFPVTKMTVSNLTLNKLSEGVIHLHTIGFKVVTANLAFGIDWSEPSNLQTYAEELRKLSDYYLNHPEIRPSDLLNVHIEDLVPGAKICTTRHCGAGVELAAYEINGTKYPCHTFAPVSVGESIAKKALNLTFEPIIAIDKFDQKCRDCVLANLCPNCYGINFSTTGNMYSKDESFCRLTKIQFLANAYLKYQQYLNHQLDLDESEEFRLLNNIRVIQEIEI